MLIGYARVSTTEQDLALQLDALKAAGCRRCFSDTASGSLKERPQLAEALKELRDGEDTLVVWRLDRLGRSLGHLIELIGELERRGLGFRSLTEGIDTTTSSGRLVFHIFGAIAEFERQLIRERTQAGLQAARARGRRGGRRTVMTEHKLRVAREMLAGGRHTMQQIADTVGVGRATLYRHLGDRRTDAKASAPSPAAPIAAPAPTPPRAAAAALDTSLPPPRPRASRARSVARRRRSLGPASERSRWLDERCPACGAAPGARCRQRRHGRTAKPMLSLHVARGWRQRVCPSCHAQPGQACMTPRGRAAASPHAARRAPAQGELVVVGDVWQELERRGAEVAEVPFAGQKSTGARFGTVRLGRARENGELDVIQEVPADGDELVQALKAPVLGRFGGFAGQPRIRGTLVWTLLERRLVISGRRGEESFEEQLELLR